jgi:hypothetical protein
MGKSVAGSALRDHRLEKRAERFDRLSGPRQPLRLVRKVAHASSDGGVDQRVLRRKMTMDSARSDAGSPSDLVERRTDASFGKGELGRGKDPRPVDNRI